MHDNANYYLARALYRLSAFSSPMQLNEVTRAYFSQISKTEGDNFASDLAKASAGDAPAMERIAKQSPGMNSMLRTTCVATQL